MRTLFILGSPRKNSNTEILARSCGDELLRLGGEVDYLRLHQKNILPCRGCGGCEKNGHCVIKNDDMAVLYKKVDDADCIVVVSPVYFYGLTAQTKLFIDRFQPYWTRKYLLDESSAKKRKVGCYIGCAATSGKRVFEGCILTVKCYLDSLNASYGGELLVRKVDGKGHIMEHPHELSNAKVFGRKIFETTESIVL